eukprot:9187958-Ditylum_brightwellii.AAC.1
MDKKFEGSLTCGEKKILRYHLNETNTTPFPVFYLLMKVHKDPWKTRPIVSYSGSLLHPLCIWVDHYLYQVAKDMPMYFKDSKTLKDKLMMLNLPPDARLLTSGATSMYTKINTTAAINEIKQFFHCNCHQYHHLPLSAIFEGL